MKIKVLFIALISVMLTACGIAKDDNFSESSSDDSGGVYYDLPQEDLFVKKETNRHETNPIDEEYLEATNGESADDLLTYDSDLDNISDEPVENLQLDVSEFEFTSSDVSSGQYTPDDDFEITGSYGEQYLGFEMFIYNIFIGVNEYCELNDVDFSTMSCYKDGEITNDYVQLYVSNEAGVVLNCAYNESANVVKIHREA